MLGSSRACLGHRLNLRRSQFGDDVDPSLGRVHNGMLPLVSVIITSYNQARFLSDAIESVLTQTYSQFEMVVVDDGSTDNASEVVARYPGVRYMRQDNQGLSAARNTGLRESNGAYLVFLDADDRLLPLLSKPAWAAYRPIRNAVLCRAITPSSHPMDHQCATENRTASSEIIITHYCVEITLRCTRP